MWAAASPEIPLLLPEPCSGLSIREGQVQGCSCNPNSPWYHLHLCCHNLFLPLKPISAEAEEGWYSLTEQLLQTLGSLSLQIQPQAWAPVGFKLSWVFLVPTAARWGMEGWRDTKSRGLQGGWVPACSAPELSEYFTSHSSHCPVVPKRGQPLSQTDP